MKIDPRHAGRLLQLVRETIAHQLGLIEKVDQSGLEEVEFDQDLATFVTLKIDGRLRGCIGNLEPTGPLLGSLVQNARHAAFKDHRFSPLKVDEFDQIDVDISILTRPVRLQFSDGSELLRKLKPGIDGVILKKGKARATFLPQVWKQLPQPRLFMEHLCQKAGLARSAWQDKDLEIYLYQVQSFEEEIDATDS